MNNKKEKELRAEYENFIETDKGKEWLSNAEIRADQDDMPDLFGLFLYDFYPEYLS
jgi:hypothetical protein